MARYRYSKPKILDWLALVFDQRPFKTAQYYVWFTYHAKWLRE